MQAEDIRKEMRRQPFVPIRMHLDDGKTYEIRHPEMVFLTTSTAYVGIESKLGSGVAADYDLVSIRHVVRLEFLDQQKTSAN
jgi:hypothetical protein